MSVFDKFVRVFLNPADLAPIRELFLSLKGFIHAFPSESTSLGESYSIDAVAAVLDAAWRRDQLPIFVFDTANIQVFAVLKTKILTRTIGIGEIIPYPGWVSGELTKAGLRCVVHEAAGLPIYTDREHAAALLAAYVGEPNHLRTLAPTPDAYVNGETVVRFEPTQPKSVVAWAADPGVIASAEAWVFNRKLTLSTDTKADALCALWHENRFWPVRKRSTFRQAVVQNPYIGGLVR